MTEPNEKQVADTYPPEDEEGRQDYWSAVAEVAARVAAGSIKAVAVGGVLPTAIAKISVDIAEGILAEVRARSIAEPSKP